MNLKLIFTSCKQPDLWEQELDEILPRFDINTKQRIACFLAQTGHESAEYNILEENLNYSSIALLKLFRKYFPSADLAEQYARKPAKIANRIYANRMGNGSEQSGDGYKFHGRGLIQLTGRHNYTICSLDLFDDDTLVIDPAKLIEPKYALASACWFWNINNLNSIADSGDFVKLTKRINGGTFGLEHRTKLYERAMKYL